MAHVQPPPYESVFGTTPTELPTKTQETQRHNMISLSIKHMDSILVIGQTPELVEVIRNAIHLGWKSGIQAERTSNESHEFKLKGNPWNHFSAPIPESHLLMVHILQALRQHGYKPLASLNVAIGETRKPAFYFDPCPPEDVRHMCLNMESTDLIRLIGAPPDIIPVVKDAITANWKRGIQKETQFTTAFTFKLCGNPWPVATPSGKVAGETLLLAVLSTLKRHGWSLVLSVDGSADTKSNLFLEYQTPL